MENAYYLAIERRPGEFVSKIDLRELSIYNDVFSNNYELNHHLDEVDFFTIKYTEADLRNEVIKSNIVEKKDYVTNGTFRVIAVDRNSSKPEREVKYDYPVLTKDVYDEIYEFYNDNQPLDINFRNKLLGKYTKILKSLKVYSNEEVNRLSNIFNEYLKHDDRVKIFEVLSDESIPYLYVRPINFLIYEYVIAKKNGNIRKLGSQSKII